MRQLQENAFSKTPASILFAALGLSVALACNTFNETAFAVDPEQPGFELPARPVVLFFVDGLRADVLEGLAQSGQLPRLQRLFFDRAARVRSAVTCVPSVTYANAVSMLTGCWPSTHGIWGNACFERQQLRTRNYEIDRELTVGDATRTTLFEMLEGELTAGIALPFERGVKLSLAKSIESGGLGFGLAWSTGQELEADRELCEELLAIGDLSREIGQWPALIAIHLPAVDGIGHQHGSDSEAYRAAVVNLDSVIGEVLETFERGGMLEQLTLVLTADHGHHPAPQSIDLETHLAAALGTPVLITLENDGDAPFLGRWQRYSRAKAVVTPNGLREASVHLRTSDAWNERPTLEEILGFGNVADESLPDRLLRLPAVELVAVHAGEHAVRVYGRSGAAEIRRTDGPHEPHFTYEVFRADDPLGYEADERLRGWMQTAHTSREWLVATADLRYPDLVPQLIAAFDDPCSGDLALFAAPGWDFSTEHYVGGHGGVEREELIVPLYFAGPDIRAGAELPAARLVDLVPTLLELVGMQADGSAPFDGVSLAEQLRCDP